MTLYYKLETMEAIDCPIEAMGMSLVWTLDLDMENISKTQTNQQINRTPRRSVRFAEQLCTYKTIPSRTCILEHESIKPKQPIPIVTETPKIIIHRAKPNLTIHVPENITERENSDKSENSDESENSDDDDWFKKTNGEKENDEEDDKENVSEQDLVTQFLNCGWLKSVRSMWYEENVKKPMEADELIYQMLETRKNSTSDPSVLKKMEDKINRQRYNDLTRTLKTMQKGRKLFGLDNTDEIIRPKTYRK